MGRPPTPRPCIEPGCRALALPGASRCPAHQHQATTTKATARNRRRRSVPGDGAATRLRAQLNRAGAGTCGQCGAHLPAHLLRVDHRHPLADGGTDDGANVWLLCVPCHDDKSTAESRARNSR